MKVAISSDFSGFPLKEAIKRYLLDKGYTVLDVGQTSPSENMMYFEAATNLAKVIQSGECEKGIVICGTGAGVSLIANKYKGVFCVACESIFTAERISLINNANVLAMGEKVVSHTIASEMASAFLDAVWCDSFDAARMKNNMMGHDGL